jgi:hypothetical protein
MKKLINISLAALAFTIIGTIDAKIMKPRPTLSQTIPVTKKEKQMFVDTKALKNASTQKAKMDAAAKLAADIKSNPNTQLILAEKLLEQEIKELETDIASKESYISYFDAEEVTASKEQLEELYQDLAEIQTQLKKAVTTRPKAVSLLNYWSVRALITTVGLVIADQLVTGGAGRAALMSGASTVGGKIGSAASTAWGYVPSWRSTPPAETMNDIIPVTTAATTSAALTWGQRASNVIASAKNLLVSGAMTGTASYIGNKVYIMLMDLEKAEKDPSVTPEELKEKIVELQELLDEFKAQNSKNK